MFLAAFPYFSNRFSTSPWLLTHFPSAIISVSTLTNLVSMGLLTHLQATASYPNRIISSLILNIVCFTLLAISTVTFQHVSAELYFAFLMLIVFSASLATGLCQNGVFAYVAGSGVGEYTQAIMTGQGVAGVLPCIAQIASVLSVPEQDSRKGATQESPKSAFAYFFTATGVSALALFAFLFLLRQHSSSTMAKPTIEGLDSPEQDSPPSSKKSIPFLALFLKLRYLALAVAVTFAITMLVFPVFTQAIPSVQPPSTAPRLLKPACFIPLAFLFWNTGDLLGRLSTLISSISLTSHPRILFLLSILRTGFIPLYYLCNMGGQGAVVNSDLFYLVVVQFLFGLSNGYLGSSGMMGVEEWVEEEEREAAGGFMGLWLVGGLTVGSFGSFGYG